MPTKRRTQTNPQPTLTQEAADQLVREGIEAALSAERERVRMEATRAGGPAGVPVAAPVARECSLMGFMKCGPTQFHGNEGVVELCCWFEKIESVFGINECAEQREKMMMKEFCPNEEVQRLENKLRSLKLRDTNIAAYTQRFNELALLCPKAVPTEKKKVELYIKGLPENIKGETTSSRPTVLNEAVRMAHTLMEQKLQAKAKRIAEGNKRKWENNNNNRRNYQNNNRHNQNNNQIHRNARALTTTQNAGANQTGVAPKCNRCGLCHFDQCPPKCNNCGKIRHKEKDCRSKNVVSGTNARPVVVCYECGKRGHKSNACPKRADRQGGNVQSLAVCSSVSRAQPGHECVDWNDDAVIVMWLKEVLVPYKNKSFVVMLFLAKVTEKETVKETVAKGTCQVIVNTFLRIKLKETIRERVYSPEPSPWGAPVVRLDFRLVITNSELEKKISPLRLFELDLEEEVMLRSYPSLCLRELRTSLYIVMHIMELSDAREKCDSTEALKEENVKAENLGRLIKPISEIHSDGI
ncbi:reverse transcriptase domain-containing protein [Tanacetum coccineum]